MKAIGPLTATMIAAVALTACSSAEGAPATVEVTESTTSPTTPTKPVLRQAYDECLDEVYDANDRAESDWESDVVTIADDDTTIIVNTNNEYAPNVYWKAVTCIFADLGTSTAIISQMDSTSALMGVQTAEADTLTYQWSYHPDNGLNLTITDDQS